MSTNVKLDIGAWLRNLGLDRYEQAFQDGEIDPDVLLDLHDADLRELGIPLGPRKKLLNAIAILNDESRSVEAERRQLTIMFCDLVDSTSLAGRLDPEDLRTVIQAYQHCCAEIIDRFDGHVANFMGDGVLAYFGYPRAHEDDAERAVRAGIDLVAAIDQLRPHGDLIIRARIGIATGEVVVGDLLGRRVSDKEAVVGETPNLAARLQAFAGSGCVVISDSTKHLLAGLFDYADLGEHNLKGFAAPVKIWRVVGEKSLDSREAQRVAGLTPMVGREDEVAFMGQIWEHVRTGEGRVVLLSGEPGIGKSRMMSGLLDWASEQPHIHLRYYCSPYHTHSGMRTILDQLERAAGYARDDAPDIKLDKLEQMFSQGSEHPTEAAAVFAPLLGIPTGSRYPPPSSELTPQQQKAKVFEVLWQQLIGFTARHPVLMIIEDAHWIDPTSAEIFDMMVDRMQDLPIMLVVAFRPGFKPPWTNGDHVSSISLHRLGHDQIKAIVERLAGGKRLPPDLIDQIVAKTDGVPLFVEELTKAVLESGLLKDEGDHYTLTGPLKTLAIPTTLQDSLMARLDRLVPGKQVAQIGAAIGREFYHQLLVEAAAPLEEKELEAALERLIATELIQCRGAYPNMTYRFKHALVQDTAYNSLLKARRQRLHMEIGKLLEEKFPHTVEAEPELLAHHYQEAGHPEAAIPYALLSGDAAVMRYASVEARARYQAALEMAQLLPASDNTSRAQIQAVLKLAEVGQNRQQFEADLQQLGNARTLAQKLQDDRQLCQIHYWIGRTNYVLGRFDAGVASAEEALHVAELLGNADKDTAGPVNLLARLNCLRGEARLASEFATRSLGQMHLLGNQIEEAGVAGVLAFAYGQQGRFKEAIDAADRGLILAQELGHLPTLAAVFQFRGVVHGWYGDLPTALADFDQAIDFCEKSGDLFRKYLVHGWRGEAYLTAGDIQAAEGDLVKCLALGEEIGTSFHRAAFQAFLAQIRLLQEDVNSASRLSADAISAAYESAQAWGRSIALRVNAAVLLATDPPDLEKAEQIVQSAIAIQERRECRCDLAWTHLVSARVYAAKNDVDGAITALTTAKQMFETMGMSHGLEVVEAVFDDVQKLG
ncbi:MAG: AAA family ATPase [Alphaproteobacteria bacterium]|nr:AAA family ATPase [Alphaproteobacteria bacterium]